MTMAWRRGAWLIPVGLLALPGACGGGDDNGDSGGGDAGSGDTASPDDDGPADSTTMSMDDDPDDGPDDDDDDDSATTVPPTVCGDGVVEGLEQCDDGNNRNGDGCEADCTETFDTSIWAVTIPGDAGIAEAGQGIAVADNGDLVVIGYIVDEVSNPDIYLVRLDGDGNEVWSSQLDLSMGGEDRGYAVAIDGDGNLGVTGDTDTGPASSDIWIAKLDPDGNELWSTTVDGPDNDNDGGRAVAFDAAGNLAVAGFVRSGPNDNDIWVGAYDPDGVELWTETIAGDMVMDDRGRGVAFDDAGDLFVSGFVSNGSFNRDVWVRKYAIDGMVMWTETWDSDKSKDDAGFSIGRSATGDVVVAGISPVLSDNQDFWLGRFDTDGMLAWWKRFGGPAIENDNAYGVALDSGDNTVAVGYKGITNVDTDIWIVKYDPTGLELWRQTIPGAGMDRDEARAVAIAGGDEIVVTGEIRDAESNDGDIWIARFGPG